MNNKYTCGKCLMGFRIQKPHSGDRRVPNWTTCTVPGCGKRFYHGCRPSQEGPVNAPVIVGMWPDPRKHANA